MPSVYSIRSNIKIIKAKAEDHNADELVRFLASELENTLDIVETLLKREEALTRAVFSNSNAHS